MTGLAVTGRGVGGIGLLDRCAGGVRGEREQGDAEVAQLLELAHLGVTAIQLMPIADFPGRWNWGYDGVAWWAPSRAYGRPDDLRRFVDDAHRAGIALWEGSVADAYREDRDTLDAKQQVASDTAPAASQSENRT